MGLCVVFAFPSSMFLCFLRLFLMLQCLSNVWCLFFAVFLCISSLRSMFWLQFWESLLYIECFSCFSMPMALQEKQTFSSRGCSLNLSIYILALSCTSVAAADPFHHGAVYICPTCSEPCFGISRFLQSITRRWFGLVIHLHISALSQKIAYPSYPCAMRALTFTTSSAASLCTILQSL